MFTFLSKLATKIVINHPKKSVIICLLVILGLSSGIPTIHKDFSHKIWFLKNDPYLVEYESFEKKFGSNDSVLIVYHSPNGIFTKESLDVIKQVSDQLWTVHDVMRVDSITNYNWTYGLDDDITTEPFIPETVTPEVLKERSDIARDNPQMTNLLISKDQNTTVIYGLLSPVFGAPRDYNPTSEQIDQILAPLTKQGHTFYVTGWGPLTSAMEKVSIHDLSLILPILLTIITVTLFIIFKSFFPVFFSISMAILAILSMAGFSGFTGISFNVVTTMAPLILLAVSMSNSIHFMASFRRHLAQGQNSKEAMENSIYKNMRPSILTSISTSIGLLSLMTTDLVPVAQLGIISGIGVMYVWCLTIFFLLPLLIIFPSFNPDKLKHKEEANNKQDHSHSLKTNQKITFSTAYANWLTNNKFIVLGIFALLTTCSVYLASQVEVNSETFDYFDDSLPIKKASLFMQDHIGGVKNIQVLIDADGPDEVKNPEFLNRVDQYSQWIEQRQVVTKVSSIIPIIKEINQALNSNKKEFYRLPETKEMVGQLLLLYTMSLPQGMGINHWTTYDYEQMRLDIRWVINGSAYALKEMEAIKMKAQDFGLKVKITGKTSLMVGLNDYIVTTFLKSMTMAIILISLFMGLVFRSVKIGILSMIPNMLPPIFGVAWMTLFGVNLDIGTVLITSISLGISVDDTIFFLSDYQKQNKGTATHKVSRVLGHTGLSLVFTTLVLVLGFLSFTMGSLIPNQNFGIITALVLAFAIVTDLVLLPALLVKKQVVEG